jgi:hypothetical protein
VIGFIDTYLGTDETSGILLIEKEYRKAMLGGKTTGVMANGVSLSGKSWKLAKSLTSDDLHYCIMK